eukprot:1004729_1
MVLTNKQEDELHKAIGSYLKDRGFQQSCDTFRNEANVTEESSIPNLLEKKWTSVVRLQRKVLLLEQENSSLKEMRGKWEVVNGDQSKNVHALPRNPPRHVFEGHRQPITCVRFHQAFERISSTYAKHTPMVISDALALVRTTLGRKPGTSSNCRNSSSGSTTRSSRGSTIRGRHSKSFICRTRSTALSEGSG